MCFINYRNQESAKVATEDIPVFKGLNVDYKGVITSPVRKYTRWKVGVTKTVWFMKKRGNPIDIQKGIHSAKNPLIARGWSDTGNVFNAIIPKGAKYWENNNEFVSNKLKLLEQI